MSAVPLLPPDYVWTAVPPLSTTTQLLDASRVTGKYNDRTIFLSVSTLSIVNAGRLPGPKFGSDQERLAYKLGQFSYANPTSR